MQVVDFSEKYLRYVAKCTHDDISKEESKRVDWIRNALSKGAVIKVAVDGGKPAGFVQAVPIEWAWYAAGKELYYIPCICVHYKDVYEKKTGAGRGRAMIEALERDLKKTTKGIAVIAFDNDFWFMPFAFFKKLGFEEVERNGETVLMVKKWADAPKPSFYSEPYAYKPIPGKITIDVYWNSICPTCITDVQNAREVCAGFPGKVVLRDFDAGFGNTKIGRGIYVNGEPVINPEGDGVVPKDMLKTRIKAVKT
ncbi:MAG: GNAT family N-acetyltransferase [Elusimicrobiota bacterium]